MINTVCLSRYSCPDGEVITRSKASGVGVVPFGCYYYPEDVQDRLIIKLKNDFYPLIPIIQNSIESKFEIPSYQIIWQAWIARFDFPSVNIHGIVKLCDEFVARYEPEYFNLIINIDGLKDGVAFGTQISVHIDSIHWSDPEGHEEFLVWDFTFAGVTENIDELFSKEAITQVVDNILKDLDNCYKIELEHPSNDAPNFFD